MTFPPGLTWFKTRIGGMAGTANPDVTYGLFGYRLPVNPELLYAGGGSGSWRVLISGLQRSVRALLLFWCAAWRRGDAVADLVKLSAPPMALSLWVWCLPGRGAALMLMLGSLGAAGSGNRQSD